MDTALLAGRRSAASAVVAVTIAVTLAGPAAARDSPDFQMPFACGERWEGSSQPSHSPSAWAVDWNRDAYDEGHMVLASAPGLVTSVVDLGDSSYGLYVVVDHGGGWTTLHAHLLRSFVVPGQRVDQGQPIALLGTSGGSTGPHLHYEQRLDRVDQAARFDGSALAYNTWLTSRNCADSPAVGDWNGDRVSDVGVFARHASSGVFRERLPGGRTSTTSYGGPTDAAVVGDWNGDGASDVGVWRPTTHTFSLATATGGSHVFSFGRAGDLPVAGDWNGDGRDDVGVFHPATATFSLRDAHGNVTTRKFGSVSSWPVAGDWNGDGRFEVGVYDAATAVFSLALPGGSTRHVTYGVPGCLPAVGSWNSDAVTDLGVWNPSTATFSERVRHHRSRTIKYGHVR